MAEKGSKIREVETKLEKEKTRLTDEATNKDKEASMLAKIVGEIGNLKWYRHVKILPKVFLGHVNQTQANPKALDNEASLDPWGDRESQLFEVQH